MFFECSTTLNHPASSEGISRNLHFSHGHHLTVRPHFAVSLSLNKNTAPALVICRNPQVMYQIWDVCRGVSWAQGPDWPFCKVEWGKPPAPERGQDKKDGGGLQKKPALLFPVNISGGDLDFLDKYKHLKVNMDNKAQLRSGTLRIQLLKCWVSSIFRGPIFRVLGITWPGFWTHDHPVSGWTFYICVLWRTPSSSLWCLASTQLMPLDWTNSKKDIVCCGHWTCHPGGAGGGQDPAKTAGILDRPSHPSSIHRTS